MTIKEAWEILSYYAYKADNEELANNHSEQMVMSIVKQKRSSRSW